MFNGQKRIGESVEGRDLSVNYYKSDSNDFSFSQRPILFLGGVHGDEKEGVWLIQEAKRVLSLKTELSIPVVLWDSVNIDGIEKNQRVNGRGVDLNRNLPTQDWTATILNPRYPPGAVANSEPENQALVKLIDEIKPCAILSAHSFSKPQVNINGPARVWGEKLSLICGYEVTEDIGYPTPGSLGTYAGKERKIPTITLEILRGITKEEVCKVALGCIDETIRFFSEEK